LPIPDPPRLLICGFRVFFAALQGPLFPDAHRGHARAKEGDSRQPRKHQPSSAISASASEGAFSPKARRQAFAIHAPPKQQRKTNARKLVKRNIFGKSLRFKARRRAFAKHPSAREHEGAGPKAPLAKGDGPGKPKQAQGRRPSLARGSARGAGPEAPLAKGDGPGRPKQAQGRRPSLARESARGACPETPRQSRRFEGRLVRKRSPEC